MNQGSHFYDVIACQSFPSSPEMPRNLENCVKPEETQKSEVDISQHVFSPSFDKGGEKKVVHSEIFLCFILRDSTFEPVTRRKKGDYRPNMAEMEREIGPRERDCFGSRFRFKWQI